MNYQRKKKHRKVRFKIQHFCLKSIIFDHARPEYIPFTNVNCDQTSVLQNTYKSGLCLSQIASLHFCCAIFIDEGPKILGKHLLEWVIFIQEGLISSAVQFLSTRVLISLGDTEPREYFHHRRSHGSGFHLLTIFSIFYLISSDGPKKVKTMKELITLLEQLKKKMEGTEHFHIQTNNVEHDNNKSRQ